MDDNKDKITEQKPEAVDEPKETLNDQKDSTVSDLLHVFDLSLLIKEVRQETKQEKKATSVQKTTNKKGVVIASLCVVGLVVMLNTAGQDGHAGRRDWTPQGGGI